MPTVTGVVTVGLSFSHITYSHITKAQRQEIADFGYPLANLQVTRAVWRQTVKVSDPIVSEWPTIRPEARAGTVAGRGFKGKVDCLAPDCNGLRAAFQ